MRTCLRFSCAVLAAFALLCIHTAMAQRVRPTDSMSVYRIQHQSQPIGNGKVLAFGGHTFDKLFQPVLHASSEIFDIATETWTPAASMQTARTEFASVVLQNGHILAIGGSGKQDKSLTSVERYDPATDTWTEVGALNKGRQNISAILLDNGRVLVMGHDRNSFEIGSPDGSGWELHEFEFLFYAYPALPQMIRMSDSRILVVGDQAGPTPNWALTVTQTGIADTTNFPMLEDHQNAGLALLPDGKVLIAGGTATSANEIFDPVTETFTGAAPYFLAHLGCPLMKLSDGRFAAVNTGTTVYPDDSYILEIYTPAGGQWEVIKGHKFTATDYHSVSPLGNGKFLISGGRPLLGATTPKCFILEETTVDVPEERHVECRIRYDETTRCIHVQMERRYNTYTATLLDVQGRVVCSYALSGEYSVVDVPVTAAGVYLLHITSENGAALTTRKIAVR